MEKTLGNRRSQVAQSHWVNAPKFRMGVGHICSLLEGAYLSGSHGCAIGRKGKLHRLVLVRKSCTGKRDMAAFEIASLPCTYGSGSGGRSTRMTMLGHDCTLHTAHDRADSWHRPRLMADWSTYMELRVRDLLLNGGV